MNKNRTGFTLIEIIMALAIMMFGVASAISLFASATTLHKKSVDDLNAAFMADTVFSQADTILMRAIGTVPEINCGSITGFPGYEYNLVLTPLDPEQNEYFASLEINWKDRGTRKIRRFNSVLLRRIKFDEKDQAILPVAED